MQTFKNILRDASILALSAAIVAPAAMAQETEERENAVAKVLSKVTITATKKSDVEDVQAVPIAVTAFNADSLEAQKVRTLEDLSFNAPNVSLTDIGTTKGAANFAMRGLGVNSSIPSIDPTVGVFVDGIYYGTNNGVVFDMFDLESIELVRGPQGLLQGRNTTGGAVIINTGNPTDELVMKGRIAVETPIEDRGGIATYYQGTVSGPLIADKLNGKIGVYYSDDDGYQKNLFDGSNHGASETTIIRGALEFLPTDTLSFLAKVERFDADSDGPSGQNRGLFDRESFDFSIDEPGFSDAEATLATLRTDWDVNFGNGTVTNILGYREYESTTRSDIDALPAPIFHSSAENEQEQISNELRYNGRFYGAADITAGLYYFDQTVKYTEIRNILGTGLYGGGEQDHTVFGIFGQLDYDFTDKLTGQFGMRYSYEEKDADLYYVEPGAPCSVVNGTCTPDKSDKDDWANVTPKLGFQYQWADTTQVYGSYTKGFRSGGYNFRITDSFAFQNQIDLTGSPAFDEEEVDALEIGVKHELADGRGLVNVALFSTEIENMQREVNIPSPISGVSQFILNTADASIEGIEIEGRYAFTDNFLVSANLGLIDASYDKVIFDLTGDGVVNGEDLALKLPRVPEATYGIGFIYDHDLGDMGSVVARANYQHRDKNFYTDNNLGFINEADMLDLNIAWNTPVDGVAVALYGKNLLDEVQAGGDTQLPFPTPNGGTFSPLKKGSLIGLELTLER